MRSAAFSFHQEAFEALFPDDAAAIVPLVEPEGELVFELLHEGGEIEEAPADAFGDFGQALVICVGRASGDFGQHFAGVGFLGEELEAIEEVMLGPALGGLEFIWDFEQEVEVVAQAAPGQAAQAAEGQLSLEEAAEELAFLGAEDDVSAGESRDDVVAMGVPFGPEQMAAQFSHEA
jgi:hypothetical protein